MKKELKIIPVPDPRLVPKYLLEQVKDRPWSVDDWYAYQLKAAGNSGNLILSLIDNAHNIVGFIWLSIDNFDKSIFINTVSIDKRYQKRSRLIKFIGNYIRDLAEKLNIDDVVLAAKRTRDLERYGFKASEYTLMKTKASEYGRQETKADKHIDRGAGEHPKAPDRRGSERVSTGTRSNPKPARPGKDKRSLSAGGGRSSKGKLPKPNHPVNPSVSN